MCPVAYTIGYGWHFLAVRFHRGGEDLEEDPVYPVSLRAHLLHELYETWILMRLGEVFDPPHEAYTVRSVSKRPPDLKEGGRDLVTGRLPFPAPVASRRGHSSVGLHSKYAPAAFRKTTLFFLN